jgi:CHAT domain-containing protein
MGLLARGGAPASAPLVLGVPDQAAPLIEREVEAVRRHARHSRVFRGSKATRKALRLSERRPAFLHVACHGFYSEDRPWNSGLRLGDAWLSLPELYGMRNTAQLVVLSGCETGRGTVYSGDEWVGLVRGFLQAGARSVVASLWEVHDRCTVSLMDSFYGGLAEGRGVAEALARAQRTARREDPMPLRWAPFVVVGDPDLRISLRKVA